MDTRKVIYRIHFRKFADAYTLCKSLGFKCESNFSPCGETGSCFTLLVLVDKDDTALKTCLHIIEEETRRLIEKEQTAFRRLRIFFSDWNPW